MIYKKSILPPVLLAAFAAVPIYAVVSGQRSGSAPAVVRVVDSDPLSTVPLDIRPGNPAATPSGKGLHYLGAKVTDVDPADARALGLSWPARGVIVDCVIAGCPAGQAGLVINDIIVGIGGQPVFNQAQFSTLLANETAPVLTFDVLRAGRQERVAITAHVDPVVSATGVAMVVPATPNPCAVCPL
jgi:membrane-associated protease RseP (regulator of RpoE activity)